MPLVYFSKNRRKRDLIPFLLFSLLFHILLLFFLLPIIPKEKKFRPPLVVERLILPQNKKFQIVDHTPGKNEIPDKADFLSKENRRVEKETKAARVGKTANQSATLALQGGQRKQPKSAQKILTQPDSQIQLPIEKPKRLSMADLSMPMQGASPTPPSQTDDYLPEVEHAAETLLNTREFVFYTYFERIKERLRNVWTPRLHGKIYQMMNKGIYLGNKEYITRVQVTLNRTGELKQIRIVSQSGYEDIDEAAIESFQEASPFPNPPQGMVENDGLVRLDWSFVLQSRQTPDIRVFLSQF